MISQNKRKRKDKQILGSRQRLKKLLNLVTAIVVGELGIPPKGIQKRLEELEISGRTRTIYTIALLIDLKNLMSIKVMVIQIVVGILGTVSKAWKRAWGGTENRRLNRKRLDDNFKIRMNN